MRNYGVTLNIHPTVKKVVIHKLPCSYYRPRRQNRRGVYAFGKYCGTFDEAMQRVSEWTLEWNAPISICAHCRGNWNLP